MDIAHHALIALIALGVDAVVGDPDRLWRRLSHPVVLIGAAIGRLDARLNRLELDESVRRRRGVVAVAILVAGAAAVGFAISWPLAGLPFGWVVEGALASILIAQKSLYQHVRAVRVAFMAGGLGAARHAVSMIVGRDPKRLDEAGVSRAAIESAAENFSDGVVAPTFWLVVFGLPGLLAYKAINTADSMIGHKSERFFAFGWAAARFDDLINLPASRLTAIWIALAARVTQGADWRSAVHSALSDAPRHRSPNAGWPEAAMAGALGLALAGPRSYGGKTIDDAWMGSGRRDATAADIHRALRLYRIAYLIQAAVIGLLAIVAFLLW